MKSKLVLNKNIKNSIGTDRIRRVLIALLRDIKKPYYYEDLIQNQELGDMSDSSIDRAVKQLQGLRILKKTPKAKVKSRGKGRGKEFSLIEGLVVFKRMFEILREESSQALLASEYTNHIIEKYSFTRTYNIIRDDIKNPDSKQSASNALLNQPAVIRKYRDDARFISKFLLKYYGPDLFDSYKLGIDLKDEIRPNSKDFAEIYGLLVDRVNVASPLDLGYREGPSSLLSEDKIEQIKSKIGYKLRPLSAKHIELLTDFDELESVRLYRNVIYREIVKLFGGLSKISGLGPKSLFQFMEYDNYLSPFTSYPVQSPEIPLFSRPFQRIYDDAYLLGLPNGKAGRGCPLRIMPENSFLRRMPRLWPKRSARHWQLQTRNLPAKWNTGLFVRTEQKASSPFGLGSPRIAKAIPLGPMVQTKISPTASELKMHCVNHNNDWPILSISCLTLHLPWIGKEKLSHGTEPSKI
jgi:hypothetical protein